jgi:hypothetical protein
MKNIRFIIFTLFILSFLGCEKDRTIDLTPQEQELEINNKLVSRYGFIGVSENIPLLPGSNLKSTINHSQTGVCLNFLDEDFKIYAFSIDGNEQRQALYESITEVDGTRDIRYIGEICNTLDDEGGGSVQVIYNNGKIVRYDPGEKSSTAFNLGNLRHPKIAMAKMKVCQREADEGTKDCFDREADEFQSDFIGIVAWHTNPYIVLLVASLCTC